MKDAVCKILKVTLAIFAPVLVVGGCFFWSANLKVAHPFWSAMLGIFGFILAAVSFYVEVDALDG